MESVHHHGANIVRRQPGSARHHERHHLSLRERRWHHHVSCEWVHRSTGADVRHELRHCGRQVRTDLRRNLRTQGRKRNGRHIQWLRSVRRFALRCRWRADKGPGHRHDRMSGRGRVSGTTTLKAAANTGVIDFAGSTCPSLATLKAPWTLNGKRDGTVSVIACSAGRVGRTDTPRVWLGAFAALILAASTRRRRRGSWRSQRSSSTQRLSHSSVGTS
jgi:hypothetical protein